MTSRNKAGCAAQMLVFDLWWRLSKEREPEVIRRDVVMEKWAYLDEPDGYTLSLVETWAPTWAPRDDYIDLSMKTTSHQPLGRWGRLHRRVVRVEG